MAAVSVCAVLWSSQSLAACFVGVDLAFLTKPLKPLGRLWPPRAPQQSAAQGDIWQTRLM